MTIFIKPAPERFYVAVFSAQGSSVKLMRVAIVYDETACIDLLSQYSDTDIDNILFDGTIYTQTGASIREKTGLPIRISKEKGKASDRIAAQKEWLYQIKYNKEMKDDADYSKFIELLSDYNDTNNPNPDPTAADLMAHAARHFRRMAE